MPPVDGGALVRCCEILEWDSAFFDRRLARFAKDRFLAADAATLRNECAERAIDGVYILVDASDSDSIFNVQRAGAFLTDARVTFATSGLTSRSSKAIVASPGAAPIRVRPAKPTDVAALRDIASVSHRDTRFYADPHFPTGACDRLYVVWIENSCRGYANAVLVAVDDSDAPLGYVTCHKDPATSTGRIGLFAVREDTQGRGCGKALMTAALAWFADNHLDAMTVATQLRNVRAVRFYARCGLFVSRADLWFHFWPADERG